MTRRAPSLLGKTVDIKGGYYAGHWGVVSAVDADGVYTVTGGSISTAVTPDTAPIFNRDEFTVRRVQPAGPA